MKSLFIINPAARGGRHGTFHQEFQDWLGKNLQDFQIQFTEGPGHATEMASRAVGQGFQHLWSVGGDGTLNEIINGVALIPENARPAVGVLSRGTGGDFARRLQEIYPAAKGWQWIEHTREVPVDFGSVEMLSPNGTRERRCFLNIADVGLSGEVVRRVNLGTKKMGSLEYVLATLSAAFKYRPPQVRIRGMEGQGFPETMPLLLFIMANGRYFGSGMCIAPEAEWDDGHFQIIAAPKVSYLSLLTQLPHLYRNRRLSHSQVYYGSISKGSLESLEGPMPLGIDGEYFAAQEVAFVNHPKGLKVLVPHEGLA